MGRRQPNLTIAQVRQEFGAIGHRMAETHAESRGRSIEVIPLETGSVQQLRPLFVSLLVLSAVVLVIVCSNVANLLLVRGTSRVREIAIRLALGATRAHILGKLMLENAILAAAGAVLAFALTIAGRDALLGMTPTTTLPLNLETPLDFRVLVFLVVLTSATVQVFDQPTEPVVYYALAQRPHRFAILHARTETNALATAPSIGQAISDVDPPFATLAPISLQDYVSAPLASLRMGLAFLGILGLAALALSAMGVQAIIAYGVAVRTREIGIRLTLGASPRHVASIFLRQTLVMTGAGIVAGLACAAVIVPVLQHRVGYLG